MPPWQFDAFPPRQVYMERVKTSTSAYSSRWPAGDVTSRKPETSKICRSKTAIFPQEIHCPLTLGCGSLFGWAQVWKITTVEGRVICFLFDSPENWPRDPKMAIFVGPFSCTAPFLLGFCRFPGKFSLSFPQTRLFIRPKMGRKGRSNLWLKHPPHFLAYGRW